MPAKKEVKCPDCGRQFTKAGISRHKCPGSTATSSRVLETLAPETGLPEPESASPAMSAGGAKTPRPRNTSSRKSTTTTTGAKCDEKPALVTCEGCGDSFKRLGSHLKFCKGPKPKNTDEKTDAGGRKSVKECQETSPLVRGPKPKAGAGNTARGDEEKGRAYKIKAEPSQAAETDTAAKFSSRTKSSEVAATKRHVTPMVKPSCSSETRSSSTLSTYSMSHTYEAGIYGAMAGQDESACKTVVDKGSRARSAKDGSSSKVSSDAKKTVKSESAKDGPSSKVSSDAKKTVKSETAKDGSSAKKAVKSESAKDGSTSSSKASPGVKKTFKSEAPQNEYGYKATINKSSLKQEAERVMNTLHLEPAENPCTETSKFFRDEVKLENSEKKKVIGIFNPFRTKILAQLKESTGWDWEHFNSGSSYDGTKVTRADEVDCMFTPRNLSRWLNVDFRGAPPGFCFIELQCPKRGSTSTESDDLRRLKELCIDGRLSSNLFREKVFQAFHKAVDEKRLAEKDPKAKPGSPSYAVLLKTRVTERSGLKTVSVDLVPALHFPDFSSLPPKATQNLQKVTAEDAEFIRRAGFDVVPKECHKEQYKDQRDFLWRLSFSRAEKRLTLYADKRNKTPVPAPPRANKHEDDEDDDADEDDVNDYIEDDQGIKSGGAESKSPRTCRKLVLRILKRLLEIIKGFDNSRTSAKRDPKMLEVQKAAEFLRTKGGRNVTIEKFTTFQIRTLLWTQMYRDFPLREEWEWTKCRPRLILALKQLKGMVSGRLHVPHFFIPDLDIMEEVPQEEREFLYIMFKITKDIF